jgi:N-acetylmuramoyl-L-alanine amidase
MILRRPVRWDNDGHTVDTVLMLAGPSGEVGSHLRILANGSQLLDSRGLRAVLKRSPDAESAWRLIEAAEQAIEERRSREGVLRELHRDQLGGAGRSFGGGCVAVQLVMVDALTEVVVHIGLSWTRRMLAIGFVGVALLVLPGCEDEPAPVVPLPRPAAEVPGYAKYLQGLKICVDPGHGGCGARPGYKRGPTGVREAEVNLRVALFLRDMLEAAGASVVMTPDRGCVPACGR